MSAVGFGVVNPDNDPRSVSTGLHRCHDPNAMAQLYRHNQMQCLEVGEVVAGIMKSPRSGQDAGRTEATGPANIGAAVALPVGGQIRHEASYEEHSPERRQWPGRDTERNWGDPS